MSIIKSVAISILASVVGTYLLRQILSAQSDSGDGTSRRPVPYSNAVVVVVPVLVGNSGNHLFHFERGRGFLR